MILALKAVMTLATLCYAVGYASRHRDNRLHRRAMLAGTALVLGGAMLLAAGVAGFGTPYHAAYWLTRAVGGAERARWLLAFHGIIAGVALVLLAVQTGTGLHRALLHTRLYPFTISLWLLTYISGMFILP